MSVENLTRFGYVRVTTGISDDWDIAAHSDGEYVKFEEAMEASSNSLQQLKAEIHSVVERLSVAAFKNDTIEAEECINKLRELSAV